MIHTEEVKSTKFEDIELSNENKIQYVQSGDSCYDSKRCKDCMTTFSLCTQCVSCCTNLFFCFNLAQNLN
jgi:hypothetical protein